MIRGGSRVCYLQVAHHELVSQEVLADCLSKKTWTISTFHVLLLLMMLIRLIHKPGTSVTSLCSPSSLVLSDY